MTHTDKPQAQEHERTLAAFVAIVHDRLKPLSNEDCHEMLTATLVHLVCCAEDLDIPGMRSISGSDLVENLTRLFTSRGISVDAPRRQDIDEAAHGPFRVADN